MTVLNCQECKKIIGHQWGGYVQDIGKLLCPECYAKTGAEQ